MRCTTILLEAVVDLGEDVANDRAEDGEDGNHDDGDQHEDQRILNQPLALDFGANNIIFSPSYEWVPVSRIDLSPLYTKKNDLVHPCIFEMVFKFV